MDNTPVYLIRSPELNVCIIVRQGENFQWFTDMVIARGGTLTSELLKEAA